jgi:hypothetical protein
VISEAELAFLRARLDEVEADAIEAKGDLGGVWTYADTPGGNHKVVNGLGYSVAEHYDVESERWFTGRHIARNDPASALREVDTWRKVMLEYAASGLDAKYKGAESVIGCRLALSAVLRMKAYEYREHPDYAAARKAAA